GRFYCEIRDNGPGFSAGMLSAAREQRLEPYASQKPDGLGLGLCLALITLDELGGCLALANDAGAVVTIELPLSGEL
ncbi:MAG: ATP-binding protein, partial [Paraperlucidibaca sp.]